MLMKKFWNIFDNVIYMFTTVVYSLLVLVCFVNVVARHVFNHPFVWSDELSLYLLVWLVFFSAALCLLKGEHVYVEALRDHIGGLLRLIWDLVVDVLIVVFMAIHSYYAYVLCQTARIDISATLGVSRTWVYVGVLIGSLLCVIFGIRVIIQRICKYCTERRN